MTEQDLVAFRRNVYLAIQSSLDFQEAAHKLIKFHLKPGLDVCKFSLSESKQLDIFLLFIERNVQHDC